MYAFFQPHCRNKLACSRHSSVTEPTSYGRVTVIGKPMVDEIERLAALRVVALRLAAETGITAVQADELVAFLGVNWSSLMREARLIPKPIVPLG